MNLIISIFHISYFILPGSGKNEICNGMPGKYIGSFQGILNDTLKLQMYLPMGNWATNARPHGASALGGAQRAPPSRKAGPLVRFNAPLGHWSLRDPATPPPTNKLSNAIVTVWLFAGADGDTLYTADEYEYNVSTVSWCQDGTCKR